ncbi:unnamed protein product [Nesidiocoris tenuis]|uniref:Uncharacterized protein n=1 Tax=Nesidiocoris tenuis TaxID=355587 RepID=A0A6H5GD76_9HEMI|nr:unnamed protein product [Nesidiocoris tenuis]
MSRKCSHFYKANINREDTSKVVKIRSICARNLRIKEKKLLCVIHALAASDEARVKPLTFEEHRKMLFSQTPGQNSKKRRKNHHKDEEKIGTLLSVDEEELLKNQALPASPAHFKSDLTNGLITALLSPPLAAKNRPSAAWPSSELKWKHWNRPKIENHNGA